ncbi:MAG: DegT/DnrJ/EryC1/StrS family aminotransferase, partial [Ignavibacteriae bacterium]|nr:DegT/DnrJ/EryC1/StrS family aminotransferase [Ignavibacteriota bacterium]
MMNLGVPSAVLYPFSVVVTMFGMRPKFVDVELDTLNIDPSKIEAAITPKTRA